MFFHILILIWATYFSEEVRFYGLPRETCGVGFSVLYILACDRHMWWVRKIISTASYKLLTKRVRATNSRWSTYLTKSNLSFMFCSTSFPWHSSWKINNLVLSKRKRMSCVSFQHWFHLKIVKILICKD